VSAENSPEKSKNISGSYNMKVPIKKRGFARRLFAFVGPAYLVSVGYMDPGNWATDIEGGARFGYMLIWVLLMSNLMAILLQTLASRLGIVTGYDLAQACRREYGKYINFFLWILAEIAITATDLAEALGTVVGLNLLFGISLLWGCAITAFDTFLFLGLQQLGIRKMEAFIVMLVATIGGCFIVEVFLAKPDIMGIASGFVPHMNSSALFVAIGMIGATVMPHNLYLHSSLVQSRMVTNTLTGKAEACKFNFLDSTVALNAAFVVNASILIMAAADFHSRGIIVTELQQAHIILEHVMGNKIAPVFFAIALIAAGQSSTLTGTISGQIVMEGFVNMKMRPWLRRLVTRLLALAPAVVAISIAGDNGIYRLLILSQVILSLQLPFAIIPLIHFTSDKKKMGVFVSPVWVKAAAWVVAAIVIALNIKLAYDTLGVWFIHSGYLLIIPVSVAVAALVWVMIYLFIKPVISPTALWESGVFKDGASVVGRIKPMPINKIGVALEHTAGDSEILSAALALAKEKKSHLTLIHVVDTPGAMVLGQESQSLHGKEDEMYLDELVREVEELDLPVESMLRFGNPATEIVKAAMEEKFDILVLGAHGHRGVSDIIYGETVSTVRHDVDIPVLIVRTRSKERAQR
jgi:manganese transport protein